MFLLTLQEIYTIAEQFKHRVTKWAPGSTEGEVVAGGVRGSSLSQIK